jgi:hypothetical protein
MQQGVKGKWRDFHDRRGYDTQPPYSFNLKFFVAHMCERTVFFSEPFHQLETLY